MSNSRTNYDREFKLNTVKLLKNGDKSMKELASDLGIKYFTLAEWKREYDKKGDQAFPGHGKVGYMTEAEKEILALKKKLRQAEMERDILKKAMAISLKGMK